MKIQRTVDVSHLSWESIESHPEEICISFKTGDKLIISWEQSRKLAKFLDEHSKNKVNEE